MKSYRPLLLLPLAVALLVVVTGRIDAQSFTLAALDGPLVVNRNATQLTIVDNRTVISWNSLNRTFVAQNDAAGQLEVDKVVDWPTDLSATWSAVRVDVRLFTGPFHKDDVGKSIDTSAHIASIRLAQAGSLGMIKYVDTVIEDNRIEVKSANMTFAIVTR